jgi:parallel beta-helix repeat protein
VHDTVDGAALRAQRSYVEADGNRFNGIHGGKHGLHLSDDGGSTCADAQCQYAGGLIHHNVIYGVEGDCVRLDATSLPVQRNELHHCTGAGLSLYHTASLTIANNLIRGNAVGISVAGGATPHLVYNTLVSNNVAGVAVNDAGSQASVVNSILWDTGTAISYTNGTSITVAFSDLQGGWTGSGEGNIDDDPRFRFPGLAIFRLLESSPCIDRGTPLSAPLDDLLGVSRPQGDGYDMGAFEFVEYHSVYLPLVMDEP